MNTAIHLVDRFSPWAARWLLLASVALALHGVHAAEPFDYFQNSWQVIGLKDYRDGTRITPHNELVLADKIKVRVRCGPESRPLSRRQTKTLLDGWLPVVQFSTEEAAVRYQFTCWATPLPTVKDWHAAFDWPTEGENYLNWVKVRASNRGDTPVEASVRLERVGTNTSTLAEWRDPLAVGQSVETVFRLPFAPLADASALEKGDAQVWLDRTVQYWRNLLAEGARIEVPCEKATQALRAAHVCQLIASDHGVLHAGEGFYDEFYIRDGGYQILELEEAGLWEPARKFVAAYLRAQRPDGRFETQADQFDANGQALWTLWQYWKITRDRGWLAEAYPSMRRAVEWIEQARRRAPSDPAFAGLLPAAPADGEFLWDGKHHIVGYDFWNLRGVLCVADAARALGKAGEAEALEREAEDYRKALETAWQRTGLAYFPPSWEKAGTHWGNTETLWPTELFAQDDPRVTATLAEVRERHGGGFVEGTIRWTGQPNAIHPYLSSYTTMASLIRAEHEKVAEELYWYLLHSSASHAFPEGVYFKRRYAWGETIPHVLGAANFAFLLRHSLLHERGDQLHLLLGVPDGWLDAGERIVVEKAPTHFGSLSMTVRGRDEGVTVSLDLPSGLKPGDVVLHLPKSRRLLSPAPKVKLQERTSQSRRWDFPAVVALYQEQAARPAKPIPALATLPLGTPLLPAHCRFLDLRLVANTDPFSAPFGVPRPGKYLFNGLAAGVQTLGGVPFEILDPSRNHGRGLVVLSGASACSGFPREVAIPVQVQGKRLFFLGNVHGWDPDDDGAGEWGAVAEYVIHYADGHTQTLPLISHRTADDWASEPIATEVYVGLNADPWHLNVLGLSLRPVPVDKIVFRDLGTPAAPVLVAVTLEK